MEEIIWATPLYEFLRRCNASPLAKEVLDCGAGGSNPPLSLFYQYGYKTFGIEIAEEALTKAQSFCAKNDMALNIIYGDMRNIPFPSERFSFVYSYNAIDFMTKPDIAISMREIARVLKSNGLCYVNFLSVDDAESWEPFCETGPAKSLLKSEGFAHFEDYEADEYFEAFEIVRKEKRLVEKLWEGRRLKQADIEYIARKR
ncbi:MAG: class I SAM-dependent methyltransferase [Anaerolineaceae bacterium]|nr:MAG: class I SAM-dependent methyltransferase [Anaerolineaceae bacterium]